MNKIYFLFKNILYIIFRVFQSLQSKPEDVFTDKSTENDSCVDPCESNVNKQSSDVTLTTQGVSETNSSVDILKNCSQDLEPLSVLSPTSHVDSSSIAENINSSNDDCKSSSTDNLLTWTSKPEHSTGDNISDNNLKADTNVCEKDTSQINDIDNVTDDKNMGKDGLNDRAIQQSETSDTRSEMANDVVSMEVNADPVLNDKVDSIVTRDTSTEDVKMEVNHESEEFKDVPNNEITNSEKTKQAPSREYLSGKLFSDVR